MPPLDPHTQRLLDEWLNSNLPHIAEECQGQLTRDAQVAALSARENGATPEQAMKRLPKFWALQIGWDTTYLRQRDVETLQWIRRQQAKATPRKITYLGLATGCALLTFSPLIAIVWPITTTAIPFAFLIGLMLTASFLVRVMVNEPIEKVAHVGALILRYHGVAVLFAVGLAFQHLSVLPSSVPSWSEGFILVYPLCYIYCIMLYAKLETRLENNREIVASILGLSGHEG